MPPDDAVDTKVYIEDHVRPFVVEKEYEVRHPGNGCAVRLLLYGDKKYNFVEYGKGTKMTYQAAMAFIRTRVDPGRWICVPVHGVSIFEQAEENEEKEENQEEVLMEGLELKKNKTVGISYVGENRVYNMQVTPEVGDLEIGNLVVAQTDDEGVRLGLVEEVHVRPASSAKLYVIQKVDTAANERLIAQRKQAHELMVRLQERVREIQKKRAIEDVVANDPEGSALVAQLRDMGVL